jgi:hypothetical protein
MSRWCVCRGSKNITKQIRRLESGGKKGKIMKSITAILCALAMLASAGAVFAQEKTCCEKAKDAGKDCSHACCVKAKKDGKVCEKCNPPKKDEKK